MCVCVCVCVCVCNMCTTCAIIVCSKVYTSYSHILHNYDSVCILHTSVVYTTKRII